MLVGDGALKFAKAIGFHEENLLVDKSRRWLVWKHRATRAAITTDRWFDAPAVPGKPSAELKRLFLMQMTTLAWA